MNSKNNITNKVIEYYNEKGFVCIPLDQKRPTLRRWNTITKTPDKLVVFQNRNIGVLTGRISGITILDLDVKNNGIKMWNKIQTLYPSFKTPTVKTPSKGLHLYFKYNNKLSSFSRFKLNGESVGWDLLNNDRQAVLPPSEISGKGKYKWLVSMEETPIIEMPAWLLNYILLVRYG